NPGVAGIIVQTPNFMGYLEDYTGFADLIHDNRSLFIVSSDPLSLRSVKSQGQWGADVAVGDTQTLGLPSYFGGPSAGYIAATKALLRKMPGRIVGQSLDRDGRRAFLLTLQAREQHIKRKRATSNICSNQALAALATTVYLAAVGKKGLENVSRQNIQKSHYLFERLTKELPVQGLYEQPFFNEFPIKLKEAAADILGGMEKEGIFAGIPLQRFYPHQKELDNVIAVAVTEKRTRQELDNYVEILKGLCDG
ncbi:MAG: glycine dehydrogenase, partial [Spirochaeta sp.]|nr:glycine dehydrogenase [Spirochaeta sp.]